MRQILAKERQPIVINNNRIARIDLTVEGMAEMLRTGSDALTISNKFSIYLDALAKEGYPDKLIIHAIQTFNKLVKA